MTGVCHLSSPAAGAAGPLGTCACVMGQGGSLCTAGAITADVLLLAQGGTGEGEFCGMEGWMLRGAWLRVRVLICE